MSWKVVVVVVLSPKRQYPWGYSPCVPCTYHFGWQRMRPLWWWWISVEYCILSMTLYFSSCCHSSVQCPWMECSVGCWRRTDVRGAVLESFTLSLTLHTNLRPLHSEYTHSKTHTNTHNRTRTRIRTRTHGDTANDFLIIFEHFSDISGCFPSLLSNFTLKLV